MRHIRILTVLVLGLCLAQAWAGEGDNETERIKKRIEPYVRHVAEQSDWLYSRLQMYWHTHATDVYIRGEKFDHPGGDRAPEPTVKFNGTRGTESQYNRPALESVVPYDDDEQGDVTFISRSTGVQEKAHPSKTGCNIASLNRQIMGIARDAALVYAATGEEQYGRLAADVFLVYMKGIYHRNVPFDLNHGHQQTLVGMATFEVIHEDILKELTQMYPLIKPLTASDENLIDEAFKKWADNIIANGVPHNNWNLFQAQLVTKIALVLRDDAAYADGRGRPYYINKILNESSVRQWSVAKLLDYGFDSNSCIWYESPGYSCTVLADLTQFADVLDQNVGIDLFRRHPIISRAVTASAQYLFPNRMIAGFGDTHPNYMNTKGMETIQSYAQRHGLAALADSMASLKAAVAPDAETSAIEAYTSPVFYAPNVSWIVQRTGMDKQHDLMASTNASLGNHQHANGISLELYGKGYVLGPDAGIGRNLYSGLDYQEYYSQMPSHNTVVVDGVSSYPVMMSSHPFRLVRSYPEVGGDKPGAGLLRDWDGKMTYTTVSFDEPETDARQQRTTAIVKTGDKGGFYVDIFRSKRADGKDKTHDYFYHNLGQTMTVTDLNGAAVSMQPTDELAFAGGHLYAYSYIYNKVCADMTTDMKVRFVTTIDDEKVVKAMKGQREITMTMWMKRADNRKAFQALSPANLEYERMPNQPYKVAEQPVLTFVARQYGEAWNNPFVAVYEPSSDTEPGEIAGVEFFKPKEKGATGVRVTMKDGKVYTVIGSENGEVKLKE